METNENFQQASDRISRIKSGLVAYYPLKGDAKDYSGNNYDGTATSQVTYAAGPFGKAAQFITSRANIELPFLPRYANEYTLSCWVYPQQNNIDPEPSEYGIIAGRLALRHLDGSLLFFFYYDSQTQADNQSLTVESQAQLSFQQWHHVLVTYSHATRILEIYINRQLDVRRDLSSLIDPTARPHLPAFGSIGGFHGNSYISPSTLNGWVSDVFFLKIASQKAEVNFLGNIMRFQTSPPQLAKVKREIGASLRIVNNNCSPAWWAVIPIIGWIALQNAADCSAAETAIPNSGDIVQRIYKYFGLPLGSLISSKMTVGRRGIGLGNNVPIHIDVGGEGPIYSNNIHTGFTEAINLQAPSGFGDGSRQTQPPFAPIPNLIRMSK